MKIIHHRLEDGMADPIEVAFMGHDSAPAHKYNDNVYQYLDKALGRPYSERGREGEYKRANDFLPSEEHGPKVFLLTHSLVALEYSEKVMKKTEIVVSSHPWVILHSYLLWCNANNHEAGTYFPMEVIHLQEFESFEMAYEVALAMREGHSLCYNK